MTSPQRTRRACRRAILSCVLLACACGPGLAGNLLEDARRQPGARTLSAGLIFRSLNEGTGVQPVSASTVVVDYVATSPLLGQFDSSYARGHPLEIQLLRAPRCWQLGLPLVRAGGEVLLTCPPDLGYGSLGSGKIPPNEPLQFRIRLRGVH